MSTITAFIFDLDGTLVDSEMFHYNCWNLSLEPYGVTLDYDEYTRAYAGVPIQANASSMINRFGLDIPADQLISERKKMAEKQLVSEGMGLMPHAKTILNSLKRAGKPLYLVTGSPRKLVDGVLMHTGLHAYFDFSVTNDDVVRSKPDPESYEKAIALSGLAVPEMLVLEDTESGVKAAMSAGLTCFAVQKDPALRPQVQGADRVFDDLGQVLEHLITEKLL